jgi:hypothetical protein
MLLCVTQAAKKLQAKSFFRREMHENLILPMHRAASSLILTVPRQAEKPEAEHQVFLRG